VREREIGCGIRDGESKDQGEEGIVCLSVRDTTVPRFNPPAESARTVGFGIWKTGFGPDSRIRNPAAREAGRTVAMESS
jgi:hypothetical protein